MFLQALSVAGALLVLGAFTLLNTGRMRPTQVSYCVMNFLGASFLAWVAVADRRAGFILLEGAWAIMSLVPLFRRGTPDGASSSRG